MNFPLVIAWILSAVTGCFATTYNQIQDVPSLNAYDFIVVGGAPSIFHNLSMIAERSCSQVVPREMSLQIGWQKTQLGKFSLLKVDHRSLNSYIVCAWIHGLTLYHRNAGVLNSMIPLFYNALQQTPYDWNFTTTPQVAVNGRVLPYPRGHILGGSSSISEKYNLMLRVTIK